MGELPPAISRHRGRSVSMGTHDCILARVVPVTARVLEVSLGTAGHSAGIPRVLPSPLGFGHDRPA
jgi:hypothetical protein